MILLIPLAFMACTGNTPKEQTDDKQFTPSTWISNRVNDSKQRMAESEAAQKLLESISAHGGLERWFANGPLSFHFDYLPLDGSTRRNTYQTINQWSVQSVHELASDRSIRFGWDGENAWVHPDTAEVPVNVRFWANTPFYFVGLPFVLADEGIQYHTLLADTLNGVAYDLVKVTYMADAGDAPDDFYVIYINQDSKLMGALRYIVSYPGFFPDGGHSPEKIMKITGLQEVNGITLPTGYETYWWKDGQVGEHITNIDVSDHSFSNEVTKSFFQMPKNSRIQEGL